MPVFAQEPSRPIQTETGPRYAQQMEYKGQKIEVATGFDILTDRWPYHVYLLPQNGGKQRLHEGTLAADSQHQAYLDGFRLAKAHLDK